MRATRFFRFLWRINGVIIFVSAVLAILMLGFISSQFITFGHHEADQVIKVDQPPQEKSEPPTLGTFQKITGTPYLQAALTFGSGNKFDRGSFSSSSGSYSIRNYLFLNSETLEGRWLFPDNKQLILELDDLQEYFQVKDSDPPTARTIAIFYQMIDIDTNGDKQLTTDDKRSIAYSKSDGSQFTIVIKGIDRILGSDKIDNGKKHVVAYEVDNKWYTAVISLSTFEIEKRGELPAR